MSKYEKNHLPRGQIRLMLLDLAKSFPEILEPAMAMIDAAEKDTFDNIVRALIQLKPSTSRELCKLSGFSLDEFSKKVRMMHERGEVHVAAYKAEGGCKFKKKVYAWGAGVDAEYPYLVEKPKEPAALKATKAAKTPKAERKRKVEPPQRTHVQPKRDIAAAWF